MHVCRNGPTLALLAMSQLNSTYLIVIKEIFTNCALLTFLVGPALVGGRKFHKAHRLIVYNHLLCQLFFLLVCPSLPTYYPHFVVSNICITTLL